MKKKQQHIFPINKQECGLFLFDSLLRKENEIYSNENKRIERVVSIKFLFIIIGYLYIYPNVGNEATLIVTKRLHCYTKVSLKFNVMFSKLVAIFFFISFVFVDDYLISVYQMIIYIGHTHKKKYWRNSRRFCQWTFILIVYT